MKKLLILTVVVLVLMSLIASSVHFEKDTGNILIDASKPRQIIWPCEIDIVGENGEEGFRIGLEVDQGWRNRKWNAGEEDTGNVKGDGYATYNFYVPANGNYTLWGYVLWDDPCTNAVYVKLDQGKDQLLGNDPVYKEWHWVRGSSRYISRGSHTLTLSNHSNNIALQKIMFVGSKYKMPEVCENYFTDIFYDDFDGCDLGNFHQWEKISGSWHVSGSEDPVCANANSLIGESTAQTDSEIRVGGDQWENYSFDIEVSLKEWEQGSSAQINFGKTAKGGVFTIQLTPYYEGQVKVQLLKMGDGTEVVLGENEIFKSEFKISLNMGDDMTLLLDDTLVIRTNRNSYQGSVSLLLKGKIQAYFDNLHIRYLESVQ